MTAGTLRAQLEAAVRQAAPKADYVDDPRSWFRDRLGEEIWSKQAEIMASIRDNKFTAVPSGHGAGKSFLGGRAICWFVDTHTPGETFVISTAPAAAQVSAILWKEVGRAHRKARERDERAGKGHGFGGKINTAGYPQWKLHDGPDGLIGYGRKPADYSESSFQGIHAPEGVLIVVDEAAGISRALMQQVDSIATTEDCRVLLIGNPTDPASYFAEACKPGSKYHVIRIDILRSPLFTRKAIEGRLPLTQALMEAEGVPYSTETVPPSVKGLTPPTWVEECLQDWCSLDPVALAQLEPEERREEVRAAAAGSQVFTARVRALFPETDANAVIPLHWVEAAMVRWEDWKAGDPARGIEPEAEPAGRRVVGVDVAREGGDSTALAIRQGHVVQRVLVYQKEDTMQTVARVRPWLDHPQAMSVVDTIGVGAGVYDRLRQLHTQKKIHGTSVGFVASAQSHRTDRTGKYRFRNDRMAAWWNMRELIDPALGSKICLPRSDSLMAQLTTPKWWLLDGSPTIIVETKDDLRKRLKRSPDEADAVVMAFWFTGAPPVSADVPAGQPIAYGGDGLPVDGVVAYPGPEPETWGGDTWADEDGVIGYPVGRTW